MHKTLTYLLVIAFLLSGCNNRRHDQDHCHDEAFLFLTVYNDDLEVFAEAEPFAVGQNSTIYAHFTSLTDFKPLEEATVTMSLIVGREGIRQTMEAPARKGIYKFSLQPVAAGQGQMIFDIITPSGEYRLIIPDIMVFDDAHEAIHAAEVLMPADPNAIVFSKEQSWKVDFATDSPRKGAFGQVIKTTAQILPAQGDELIITSRTSGVVVLGAATLAEGRQVSRGMALMNISSVGMADNNMAVRLAEARNNYEKAQADLERAEKLAVERIIPERELLQAKTEFENARAVFENLSRNFSQAGQSVTSPTQGVIKQLLVANGQFVEAGQPLLSIMQNRRLQLRADVRQNQAALLQSLVSANIRTLHNNRSFTLEELGGRIVSAGLAANTENFLVPLVLEVNQNGHLLPGGFAELYLIADDESEILTLPNEAVMEEQGLYYVFVQLTPEMFTKREVGIGATDGIRTEIIRGLHTNERVVTIGAVWVKLAQSSAALDPHAGHVH